MIDRFLTFQYLPREDTLSGVSRNGARIVHGGCEDRAKIPQYWDLHFAP